MENNKNVIIAVLLMLSIWFFYNSTQQPAQAPVAEPASATDVSAQQPARSDVKVVAVPESKSAPETRVSVSTPLFTTEFNSIGARLTSLQLHGFSETAASNSPEVKVINAVNPRLGSLSLAGKGGLPLATETAYVVVDTPAERKISGSETADVVFSVSIGSLLVERIFTLHADSYVIDVQNRISNVGSEPISGELELALLQQWDDENKSDMVVFNGASSLVNDSLSEVSVDDLEDESPSYDGSVTSWTSFQTKYFMSALLLSDSGAENVRVFRDGNLITNLASTPYITLAPGETRSFTCKSYFGPRDEGILESVGGRLSEAISFGWFTPIAMPLLKVLNFFYSYIGNYGIAIILLTVIIKLIFWPLTHKSYASMKAMSKLQPEMTKIKERFKNDRQRQGQEMMELYKKHRVNPMGGCMPMLIQIPVFFALYRVLYQAIELRHAPFMFWITDLSAKDPYYITPVVMGATMFIQQKLTPTNTDPNMAKMMLLMPIVFTFMFLNFPAGLVIYWLVNNLLTIAQQVYIHRTMS